MITTKPLPAPTLPEGRILAAVSGGADSIALLRLLVGGATASRLAACNCAARRDAVALPLVAHFNHKIRGAESDADEAFVRGQAAALGIPFFSGGADVPAIAKSTGEVID